MRKSQLTILGIIVFCIYLGIRQQLPAVVTENNNPIVLNSITNKINIKANEQNENRSLASLGNSHDNKINLSELRQLVDDDEICKVMALGDLSTQDIIQASIGTYDINDPNSGGITNELHTLYAPNTDLVNFSFKLNNSNESLATILALKLANLFEGGQSSPTDFNRAKSLLNELKSQDKDNSFYSYFLVAVLDKLGAHDWEIKSELEEAFKKKYFNSPYNGVIVSMNNHLLNNATRYYLLQQVIISIPVPLFNPSSKILSDLIDQNDLNFNQGALNFCKSMMIAGKDNKANGKGGAYNALEYSFGRNCFIHAWNKLYPGSTPPNSPTFNELIKDEIDHMDKMINILDDLKDKLSSCPRAAIDNELEKSRKLFYGKFED